MRYLRNSALLRSDFSTAVLFRSNVLPLFVGDKMLSFQSSSGFVSHRVARTMRLLSLFPVNESVICSGADTHYVVFSEQHCSG
jgi:hypothetical protein